MSTPENTADAEPKTLQGVEADFTDPATRTEAVERAFDYRGDVTIHTTDGRTISGYVYDRLGNVPDPFVRVMPADSLDRLTIKIADISKLVFTGRDTAAGKSWETWVKKHAEKRARGEAANIEPEPLD